MTDPRDDMVRRLLAAEPLLRRLQFTNDMTQAEYHLLDGLLDVTHQYRTSRPQVTTTVHSIRDARRSR